MLSPSDVDPDSFGFVNPNLSSKSRFRLRIQRYEIKGKAALKMLKIDLRKN